jgi:hypothetical protein
MTHRTCSVTGCDHPVDARGWCKNHYSYWRYHGTIEPQPRRLGGRAIRGPLAPRFWAKVRKGDGCWEWQGATRHGYGTVWVAEAGGMRLAHRIAWELTNGPIPDGLLACHHCDNRVCVRPDHLFLGTYADNAQDMSRKGRAHGFGRWSQQFAACIECGTTERRHISKGRCWKCYARVRRAA